MNALKFNLINKKKSLFVLIFITLQSLHLIKIFKILPIDVWRTTQPLMTGLYGWDTVRLMRDQAARRNHASQVYYDPFRLAGYPAGLLFELGSELPRQVSRLLPFINPGFLIKSLVFILFFIGPILIFVSARNFGCDPPVALIAMALGVSGFLDHDPFSKSLVDCGWYAFLSSSYMAVLILSCLTRMFKSRDKNNFIVF
jgi:hypothetical protein